MSGEQIPYDEVDKNVRLLVVVLNRFPGLHTIGSCGGHSNPAPYQEPEGQWYVSLQVDHNEEGWRSLEFLAWAVGDFKRAGRLLSLEVSSPPPYMNTPGQCLSFVLRGKDFTPDDLAAPLDEWREEDYVAVEDDEAFKAYTSGSEADEE